MAWAQRLVGDNRMAYLFLGPNILFFGVFVFLPIGINIALSVTGGTNLFLADRPYIGSGHYDALLACGSYLDPGSCREDHFWKGVANTLKFTVFQMIAMVGTALITALVLNRKIRGRGFFRFGLAFFLGQGLDVERDLRVGLAVFAGARKVLDVREKAEIHVHRLERLGLGPAGDVEVDRGDAQRFRDPWSSFRTERPRHRGVRDGVNIVLEPVDDVAGV